MFSPVRSSACPNCGSGSIRRSRRNGLLEFLLHWVLHTSPFRCMDCYERYFRFRVPQRQPDPAAPKPAH